MEPMLFPSYDPDKLYFPLYSVVKIIRHIKSLMCKKNIYKISPISPHHDRPTNQQPATATVTVLFFMTS